MYPVMINIREKKVVVVGGGKVAARKIKTLLAEQAAVTVVSPTLHADIPHTLLSKKLFLMPCFTFLPINTALSPVHKF